MAVIYNIELQWSGIPDFTEIRSSRENGNFGHQLLRQNAEPSE